MWTLHLPEKYDYSTTFHEWLLDTNYAFINKFPVYFRGRKLDFRRENFHGLVAGVATKRCHAPPILQRKLSWIAAKPWNLQKFSPSKVFRYTVYFSFCYAAVAERNDERILPDNHFSVYHPQPGTRNISNFLIHFVPHTRPCMIHGKWSTCSWILSTIAAHIFVLQLYKAYTSYRCSWWICLILLMVYSTLPISQ